MLEKIKRTCRYGHGDLVNQCQIGEDGQLLAFAFTGIKLSIWAISPDRGEPVLSALPDERLGHIVQLHKCPVCGYMEIDELTNEDAGARLRQKEVEDAIGRK